MSGMIVIPASLRSDFIHMAGMTIHIALESTIHIAGIRTLRFLFVKTLRRLSLPKTSSACRHTLLETVIEAALK
jgi:hypothetical protein